MISEAGYYPLCQMDDSYFFEFRWMGQSQLITLRKINGDQWEVEFPRSLHQLVAKKIGLYSKLPLLSAKAEMEP
jgi:hypothetical protein